MLTLSGVAGDGARARDMLEKALDSGAGLKKFKDMIAAQGGDPRVCDDVGLLPRAPLILPVRARETGWLAHMDGTAIGLAAQRMGAGRVKKDDVIDPAVGFVMGKRIGDRVEKGDVLFTLHARDEETARETEKRVLAALSFSPSPAPRARLLYALVTPEGVSYLE